MTSIPILDLTTQYRSIQADVEAAVLDVLQSGRYIKGEIVSQFEQELAQYVGSPHCISCNSGTDALYLALRAMNIGPGDEIITSPFTFIATAEVISALGATPVFVDIDIDTFNLDLKLIAEAITERTRAIIPVHIFGHPVNMPELMAIAKTYQLWVIEDCAQAIGASWDHQKVGSFGDIGCFSFYPTKNLGACGDGGAITVKDEAIAHKIRTLADHGRTHGYYHEAIGVNSRLDAIQAAILRIKLQHLEQWNQQRRAVAQHYYEHLSNCSNVVVPTSSSFGQCVWHQYTLRIVPEDKVTHDVVNVRDRIKHYLNENNIGSMVYYPLPLHQQPVYSKQLSSIHLPIAEQAATQVLSLPMFPELTPEQQDTIVHTLKSAIAYVCPDCQAIA
ncbi:MAG: DegT/DnrJ/EryC1/StrS family aminotransferase [Cyanobacteria bacterium P01_F01_bin.150]